MKAIRLLLPLCALLFFCPNLAFAGPQIAVSDPTCDGGEIQLHSNSYQFTVTSTTTKLTFCNATEQNWRSLNFTISFDPGLDLSGIYCGAPDTGAAAFDYCMVQNPNDPITGTEPGFGAPISFALIHEFTNFNGDTPTGFYQTSTHCFFGCDDSEGGPTGSILGNLVYLSFNLAPADTASRITYAASSVEAEASGAPGLLHNHQFTIDFGCPEVNLGCTPVPDGTGFSLLTSTSSNTTTFPDPVPEPATIMLVAGAGLPALLRRLRKS